MSSDTERAQQRERPLVPLPLPLVVVPRWWRSNEKGRTCNTVGPHGGAGVVEEVVPGCVRQDRQQVPRLVGRVHGRCSCGQHVPCRTLLRGLHWVHGAGARWRFHDSRSCAHPGTGAGTSRRPAARGRRVCRRVALRSHFLGRRRPDERQPKRGQGRIQAPAFGAPLPHQQAVKRGARPSTNRQAGRQAGRQIDRQTDRQTDMLKDRQTDRQADRQTGTTHTPATGRS